MSETRREGKVYFNGMLKSEQIKLSDKMIIIITVESSFVYCW